MKKNGKQRFEKIIAFSGGCGIIGTRISRIMMWFKVAHDEKIFYVLGEKVGEVGAALARTRWASWKVSVDKESKC